MTSTGPVVVATAMALNAEARARLSDMLGAGFLVLDIRTAPASTNIVIAPHVSDMALSHLRGMFPQARILFSELFDPQAGIDFRGPVYAALSSDADGYLVAPSLNALSHEVTQQAALQLTGSRAQTPLQLLSAPTPAPPATHPEQVTAATQMPLSERRRPTVWWINGPFGVGKTTLVRSLATQVPDIHVFDPEEVGFMLRRIISEPVDDFQSWPAWRALVAETAIQLVEHHNADLVCPMSLLNQHWAHEIFTTIEIAGIPQRHILLHADETTLRHRILNDPEEHDAIDWRLQAIQRFNEALPWLRTEAEAIDTTRLRPNEVAQQVAGLMNAMASTTQ